MTAEKKPRRKWTDADRLTEQAERVKILRGRLYEAESDYNVALKAAHDKAKAIAANLPPLPPKES